MMKFKRVFVLSALALTILLTLCPIKVGALEFRHFVDKTQHNTATGTKIWDDNKYFYIHVKVFKKLKKGTPVNSNASNQQLAYVHRAVKVSELGEDIKDSSGFISLLKFSNKVKKILHVAEGIDSDIVARPPSWANILFEMEEFLTGKIDPSDNPDMKVAPWVVFHYETDQYGSNSGGSGNSGGSSCSCPNTNNNGNNNESEVTIRPDGVPGNYYIPENLNVSNQPAVDPNFAKVIVVDAETAQYLYTTNHFLTRSGDLQANALSFYNSELSYGNLRKYNYVKVLTAAEAVALDPYLEELVNRHGAEYVILAIR